MSRPGETFEYRITAPGYGDRWERSQRVEWDTVIRPHCERRGDVALLECRVVDPQGVPGEWEIVERVNC